MRDYDATEQAFRNGYSAGYAAGRRSKGDTIPVTVVREYLLRLIDEWNKLGDRKYELPNMQVYNHVRLELDALEAYVEGGKHDD